MPAVIPVASHTLFVSQIVSIYKTTAPVMLAKSPLEKENKMMNVKQQTIAGPRSPNIKNNKIVARIAINAKAKNEERLCQEVYSEINFSLAEK